MRDFSAQPKLIVIRSFDVNKPGAEVADLKGGVAGGSLLKGVLRVRRGSYSSHMTLPLRSRFQFRLRFENENAMD